VSDVVQHLLDKGYKEYPVHAIDRTEGVKQRIFQRIFHEASGERCINIYRYEPTHLNLDKWGVRFEIEAVFEIQNKDWVKFMFYGVREKDLIERLDHYEDQIAKIFSLLGGVAR
jgi:hypothetical protein